MADRFGFGMILRFASEIDVPEFPAAPASEAAVERQCPATNIWIGSDADVMVGEEPAERTRTLRAAGTELFWVDRMHDGRYRLTVPSHGVFLVSAEGREVVCRPASGVTRWDTILGAQVLPLAATLAGTEVLHASGVAIDGAGFLLSAPPGVGKTSLAAHLVAKGAELLADDAVALRAVSGGPLIAYPAGRWLHLMPDEAARVLAVDPPRFEPAGVREDKRVLATSSGSHPAPLRSIYLLAREETGTEHPITLVSPVSPAMLLSATFNLSVKTPDRLRRQLELCHRVAQEVPCHRVAVRRDVPAGELASTLLEHMQDNAG